MTPSPKASSSAMRKLSLVVCAALMGLSIIFWPDLAAAQDSGGALDGLRDMVGDEDAPAFNARILQLFFLVTILSLSLIHI